jgi:hypothetical protein
MKGEELIPPQKDGIQTNTESTAELETEAAAKAFFDTARDRLLSVNRWHEFAGKATADFQLTDPQGNAVNRAPRKGDFFRINIPAPGNATGDGFDWVRIEDIEEKADMLAIRVRPASNPQNEDPSIAHFFSGEATSSFMVRREGNKVLAGVYGRNEKPNTETESLKDKIRNAAIATGAIGGFAKLQWKSLVNGLLERDK